MNFSELPQGPLLAFALVWGLLWGSFLNVVVYRVPRGLSVVRPRSACPGCGTPIAGWDNIPVFSWLLLRGKSRCCKTKISSRYPLVELASGALAVLVFQARVLGPGGDVATGLIVFLLAFALAWNLLGLALIDWEYMILPDAMTLGGAAVGLLTASFRHTVGWGPSWFEAALASVGGVALIWVPFIWGYEKLRGMPGMGLGDAKLMALGGAWFGWPGILFPLFAGALQGTLVALTTLLVRGRIEEPEAVRQERVDFREALEKASPEERVELEALAAGDPLADEPDGSAMHARMAFGPFLALGMLEWLLFEVDLRRVATEWLLGGS